MTRALLSLALLLVAAGCRVGDGTPQPQDTRPSLGSGGQPQRPASDPSKATDPAATASAGGQRRLASLAEFQQFLPGSGKPQGERLTGILQVLRREVCNPGWPSMGLGGPISSGYVLQQGVLNLGLDISPGLLRHARADEKDPKIRDLLAVALSVARDPSVTKEVRSLARDHPLGSIRQLAIKGLGRLRDAESRDLFLAALNDRYTAVAGESPDGPVKLYPVRIQAASALRAIGERPPAGAVMSVPLPGSESDAAFCAHLLDDQDPESSLTGVQLLIGEGHRGRPYLQAFLKKNENEPSLKQSIELARKSLQ